YGFGEAEILGRSMDVLFDGGDWPNVAAAIDRAKQGHAVEQLEAHQLTKDGRHIDALLTISPISPASEPIGISIVSRDITARKQAEESLRRSEATARAFLESASESVIVADPTGRIALVNSRTESMFGYSRDELIGQAVEMLIPTSRRAVHMDHRA